MGGLELRVKGFKIGFRFRFRGFVGGSTVSYRLLRSTQGVVLQGGCS